MVASWLQVLPWIRRLVGSLCIFFPEAIGRNESFLTMHVWICPGGAAGQCDIHSILRESTIRHSQTNDFSTLSQQPSNGVPGLLSTAQAARDASAAEGESIPAHADKNVVEPVIPR